MILYLNVSYVVLKVGFGVYEIGYKIIGVVENMSYYYNEVN